MLHRVFDEAFDDLLTIWRVHDDLRRSRSTPISRLGESRTRLDNARERVDRLRMALHPFGNDRGLIAFAVLCENLDEIVHIPALGIESTPTGVRFGCVCGQTVERPAGVSESEGRRARA